MHHDCDVTFESSVLLRQFHFIRVVCLTGLGSTLVWWSELFMFLDRHLR